MTSFRQKKKKKIKEESNHRDKGQVGGDEKRTVAILSPLTTAAENKEQRAVQLVVLTEAHTC